MQVSPELKAKVNRTIADTILKIETLYDTKITQPIDVRYDIDSARLGGQAHYSKFRIRLNPAFLNKYQDEYMQTVIHEVVHLGVYHVYFVHGNKRVSAHGPEWKRMMVRVGARPDRCHNYEAEVGQGRQKTKYAYKCSKCSEPIPVGPVIHAKLQKGVKYTPRCCGRSASLVFVGSAGAVPKHVVREMIATNTIPTTPTTNVPKMKAPDPNSKLGKCYAFYKDNYKSNITRGIWIAEFVLRFGCTTSGASTYVNTCSKLKAAGI